LKRDGFVRVIFPAVAEQNSPSRLGAGGRRIRTLGPP
jgi:hypothetical protein